MLKKLIWGFIIIGVAITAVSCAGSSPSDTTSTPLSLFDLRYSTLDAYPNYFWCDPDFYPIGSPGGELANALAQFDNIQSNTPEFTAIINRIGLDRKTAYTSEEKLLVYRQHKLLTKVLVDFQPASDGFTFVVRVGEGQGQRITGNISTTGIITVTKTESSFNTCPICLSKGTLIDTPDGPVPVDQLIAGALVWTLDRNGERVAAAVIKTTRTPEPSVFELLRISLADGRALTASPRHPASDGRLLGNLRLGEQLDGSAIITIEQVVYEGRTYDILPEGSSGTYWANAILLANTIAGPDCGC